MEKILNNLEEMIRLAGIDIFPLIRKYPVDAFAITVTVLTIILIFYLATRKTGNRPSDS
ncbi:MAG: hypothetical protein PHP03_02825 [Candidatus Pacebacteria bacterium]|nr:hypothetical protein [Candidatus Paceibacterota bacterium]